MANLLRNFGTSLKPTEPKMLQISSSYAELVASLAIKDPLEHLVAIVQQALPQIIPTWLKRCHYYREEYKIHGVVASKKSIICALMEHYGFVTHFTKDNHQYSPIALVIRLWDYDANGILLTLKLMTELMATPKQLKNLAYQPNELVLKLTFCLEPEVSHYEPIYIPWKGTVSEYLEGNKKSLVWKGDAGHHLFGFMVEAAFIEHPDNHKKMASEYYKRITPSLLCITLKEDEALESKSTCSDNVSGKE